MKRSVFILFALVIALSLVLVPSVAAGSQGESQKKPLVVSTMGLAKVQGKDVIVDVLVVVPPGQNANEAALEALRQQGARPFESAALGSAGFTITGLFWENLPVFQNYNPSNEPIGGVTALKNTHTTWNAVTTSDFNIGSGDLNITRYPSLVRESPGLQYYDYNNDVAWMRLPGNILGVTWYSTIIDEADMALNTRFPWSVDGTPGTYDIETVFLHENGHVVGLGHSDVAEAVMYTSYQEVRCSLASDDEEGATYLYDSEITGVVSGHVTDGTNPINDALVELEDTTSPRLYAYTDVDGYYLINYVPDPVTYTITATANGFESSTKREPVDGDKVVDFILTAVGGVGPAPVVDSCDPNSAYPNERLTVNVHGENFQDGATVDFGTKVSITGVTFINDNRLDVNIKVNPKATSGSRDVTVTNPDGQSGTKEACFYVN
ncbi:matrixin family metalloprotease [Chloroflexota bacterium]